jgi:hypothetical protein
MSGAWRGERGAQRFLAPLLSLALVVFLSACATARGGEREEAETWTSISWASELAGDWEAVVPVFLDEDGGYDRPWASMEVHCYLSYERGTEKYRMVISLDLERYLDELLDSGAFAGFTKDDLWYSLVADMTDGESGYLIEPYAFTSIVVESASNLFWGKHCFLSQHKTMFKMVFLDNSSELTRNYGITELIFHKQ